MQGDATIEERLSLIIQQQEAVRQQIAELQQTLDTLDFKRWYYETAKETGTTEVPRNMPLQELLKQFRAVGVRLRGE